MSRSAIQCTYEDHGIFANVNISADEVGAHVSHNKALVLLCLTLCLQHLGEDLEFHTVHRLVVAEVDKGGAFAALTLGRSQRPRVFCRDLAKLSIIGFPSIQGDVHVLRTDESGRFLRSLERPGSGHEIIQLQLLVHLLLQSLENQFIHLGVLRAEVGLQHVRLGPATSPFDPDRDEIVHDGAELAATTALHEQNFIVVWDVEKSSQVRLGVVEDLVGGG